RRRISPSLSEVAAAVAVRNSLKMNSITYLAAKGSQPRRGGWWRLWRAVEVGGGRSMTSTIVHQPPLTSPSWHRPRKHDVGSERLKQLRTHPRHTVEPRQPAERTVLLAPRDDPLRERGPDSRETRDLRHVGAVEVDALTGEQRPPRHLLSHERDRHITHDLKRRGTDFVDRIVGGMPVRVVEVHDVDRVDARLLQRDVVVSQGVPHAGYEHAAVAQVGSDSPHPVHDLRCHRLRVALVVELL